MFHKTINKQRQNQEDIDKNITQKIKHSVSESPTSGTIGWDQWLGTWAMAAPSRVWMETKMETHAKQTKGQLVLGL